MGSVKRLLPPNYRRLLQEFPCGINVHSDPSKLQQRHILIFLAIAFAISASVFLLCSLLKCIRRQVRNPAVELPLDSGIQAIPVVVYGSLSDAASEEVNCAICLEKFGNEDRVRVLPRCKHVFHKECIDQWLGVRSLHCPICRDRTIEQEVEIKRTNCRNDAAQNPTDVLALEFAPRIRTSSLA